MPMVSPGQMLRLPDWRDGGIGLASHPARMENGRRYWAKPRGELSDSHPMSAMPGEPEVTAMMCSALSWSGVTRWAGAHVRPRSVEYDSQPMSPPGLWVSQVAYRFPAASLLRATSIQVTNKPIRPAPERMATGFDHVRPPSAAEVKTIWF